MNNKPGLLSLVHMNSSAGVLLFCTSSYREDSEASDATRCFTAIIAIDSQKKETSKTTICRRPTVCAEIYR